MALWRKKGDSRLRCGGETFLERLRSNTSGNTLAMGAAAFVPIAAMIGSGLDMSRAYMAQAKLQNACDAGALAGRREMSGAIWTSSAQTEAERFFDFNFPATTMNAENVSFTISQDSDVDTQINGRASADIPTTVMTLFGNEFIPISVECDAKQDYGNNDVMVVLDVTGSMNCPPGTGGSCGNTEQTGSKASRLRTGASALYNALAGSANTRTRYALMPYSITVNVGGDLRDRDFRRKHYYFYNGRADNTWSRWEPGIPLGFIQAFRAGDEACIEERSDIGTTIDDFGDYGEIETDVVVTQEDIDLIAATDNDYNLQWAPYIDMSDYLADSWSEAGSPRCPAAASRLQEYSSVSDFDDAIDAATADLGGNTYHDIGMVWAIRYLSRTGMFSSDNAETYNGIPVQQHIVFMTDGILTHASDNYTAFAIDEADDRISGPGGDREEHVARFQSACNLARTMGITVWVIVLAENNTADIEGCATSDGHFYESDGSDLEEVFAAIGQGIGELRLTQ